MSDRNIHHRPDPLLVTSRHRTGTGCWCNPVIEIVPAKSREPETAAGKRMLRLWSLDGGTERRLKDAIIAIEDEARS